MKEKGRSYSDHIEYTGSARKIIGGTALSIAVAISSSGAVLAENANEKDDNGSPILTPTAMEDRNTISNSSPNVLFENESITVAIPNNLGGESEYGMSLIPSLTVEEGRESGFKEVKPNNNIYKKNLFSKNGYVKQPDNRTCVAAATQMMLNFDKNIKESNWNLNTSSKKTYEIFAYARANDTLDPAGVGSDVNGWDRALEHFGGWDEDVYKIRAYKKRLRAIKDAVSSIARTGKPVGMLGWAGTHAQVVTAYKVEGNDPAQSKNYKVKALFLSDPLPASLMVGKKVSDVQLSGGNPIDTFSQNKEKDSHNKAGKPIYKRWYDKFILILPTR